MAEEQKKPGEGEGKVEGPEAREEKLRVEPSFDEIADFAASKSVDAFERAEQYKERGNERSEDREFATGQGWQEVEAVLRNEIGQQSGIKNLEDAVKWLSETIDKMSSSDRQSAFSEKRIKILSKTLEFIQNNSEGQFKINAVYLRYKGEAQEASVAQAKALKPEEQATLDAAREVLRPEARDEQEKLIQEILKVGGAEMHMSMPETRGFGEKSDQKLKTRGTSKGTANIIGYELGDPRKGGLDPREAQRILDEKGINEVLMVTPQTKAIMGTRDKVVTEKTGFFGRETRRVAKKPVQIGSEPQKMDDFVTGAGSENAITLNYFVFGGDKHEYFEFSNRRGQVMSMSLTLPESLANQVLAEISKDPAVLRTLAEKVAIEELGINEDDWRDGKNTSGHPLRPPYESWAQTGGAQKILEIDRREEDAMYKGKQTEIPFRQ